MFRLIRPDAIPSLLFPMLAIDGEAPKLPFDLRSADEEMEVCDAITGGRDIVMGTSWAELF
jgi:hypothetical protein